MRLRGWLVAATVSLLATQFGVTENANAFVLTYLPGTPTVTIPFEEPSTSQGDPVTTQYAADGVTFGSPASLGAPITIDPASATPCGAPIGFVPFQHTGAQAVEVPSCSSGQEIVMHGTLLKFSSPRHYVSTYVGTSNGAAQLLAFDAAGEKLAETDVSPSSLNAQKFASVNAGGAGMTYLVIQAGSGSSQLAFDDLSFADAAITPTASGFSARAGAPFQHTVGSFHDADGGTDPSHYQVAVDWGDGTSDSAPTITSSGGGDFSITSHHTYASPGSFQVTIRVVDRLSGQDVSARADATVATGNNASGTTGDATNITDTSATLDGLVDPGGQAGVLYQFRYGTTTDYGQVKPFGSNGFGEPVGYSDDQLHHVPSVVLTGLSPNTTYHYQLAVNTPAGATAGADRIFTTGSTGAAGGDNTLPPDDSHPGGPPSALTGAPTFVTTTTAHFTGTVDPAGQATQYHFEYGTTALYGSSTPTGDAGSGTGTGAVTFDAAGLAADTEYHYRLVATNASGTAVGGDEVFSTAPDPPSPQSATGSINNFSDLASTGITLIMAIDPHGSAVTYYCEYVTAETYHADGDDFAPAHAQSGGGGHLDAANGQVGALCPLDHLTPDTTYFVRCHFDNAGGGSHSATIHFTTLPPPAPPKAQTEPADDIGEGAATLTARVNTSGQDATYHLEYWSTNPADAVSGPEGTLPPDDVNHTVSLQVAGLASNTRYHYRVVATNPTGTTTANVVDFTTLVPPSEPAATTLSATDITQHDVHLHGSADPHRLGTTTRFEWGTTTAYGNVLDAADVAASAGTTAVDATLTGLDPGTTYHYRFVATNVRGITYGADATFTTVAPPPPSGGDGGATAGGSGGGTGLGSVLTPPGALHTGGFLGSLVAKETPPAIVGPVRVGLTLTADPGHWAAAKSFTYAWTRCLPPPKVASPKAKANAKSKAKRSPRATAAVARSKRVGVPKAKCTKVGSGQTHDVKASELGDTFRLAVSAGGQTRQSASTEPAQEIATPSARLLRAAQQRAGKVQFTSQPSMIGAPTAGSPLVAGSGGITGGATPKFAWLSCSTSGASCRTVSRKTAYTPNRADVGRRIEVRETIRTAAGRQLVVTSKPETIRSAPRARARVRQTTGGLGLPCVPLLTFTCPSTTPSGGDGTDGGKPGISSDGPGVNNTLNDIFGSTAKAGDLIADTECGVANAAASLLTGPTADYAKVMGCALGSLFVTYHAYDAPGAAPWLTFQPKEQRQGGLAVVPSLIKTPQTLGAMTASFGLDGGYPAFVVTGTQRPGTVVAEMRFGDDGHKRLLLAIGSNSMPGKVSVKLTRIVTRQDGSVDVGIALDNSDPAPGRLIQVMAGLSSGPLGADGTPPGFTGGTIGFNNTPGQTSFTMTIAPPHDDGSPATSSLRLDQTSSPAPVTAGAEFLVGPRGDQLAASAQIEGLPQHLGATITTAGTGADRTLDVEYDATDQTPSLQVICNVGVPEGYRAANFVRSGTGDPLPTGRPLQLIAVAEQIPKAISVVRHGTEMRFVAGARGADGTITPGSDSIGEIKAWFNDGGTTGPLFSASLPKTTDLVDGVIDPGGVYQLQARILGLQDVSVDLGDPIHAHIGFANPETLGVHVRDDVHGINATATVDPLPSGIDVTFDKSSGKLTYTGDQVIHDISATAALDTPLIANADRLSAQVQEITKSFDVSGIGADGGATTFDAKDGELGLVSLQAYGQNVTPLALPQTDWFYLQSVAAGDAPLRPARFELDAQVSHIKKVSVASSATGPTTATVELGDHAGRPPLDYLVQIAGSDKPPLRTLSGTIDALPSKTTIKFVHDDLMTAVDYRASDPLHVTFYGNLLGDGLTNGVLNADVTVPHHVTFCFSPKLYCDPSREQDLGFGQDSDVGDIPGGWGATTKLDTYIDAHVGECDTDSEGDCEKPLHIDHVIACPSDQDSAPCLAAPDKAPGGILELSNADIDFLHFSYGNAGYKDCPNGCDNAFGENTDANMYFFLDTRDTKLRATLDYFTSVDLHFGTGGQSGLHATKRFFGFSLDNFLSDVKVAPTIPVLGGFQGPLGSAHCDHLGDVHASFGTSDHQISFGDVTQLAGQPDPIAALVCAVV